MKKAISVLLSALMLCGCLFAFGAGAAQGSSDFVPTFRFIVSSDTHVRDDSDVTANRIGKMLALGYEAAGSDPDYNKLDAVLICGDLTNNGTTTQFDKFWAAVSGAKKDETRFLGVVAKNHDGYTMSRSDMRAYYENLTGNEADFHVVLGGYHFIGISASENGAVHYSLSQLRWLQQELTAATAQAPDRPVFVMHHEHNRDTVYGSSSYDGWGVTYFKAILRQFPQVVDFSGHSHYPLNDPRSVWQGRYTCVGTGAIYYSEFTVSGVRTYHPADSDATATCWIAELNAENDLRLTGMDVEAGKPLCEYVLKNPAKSSNREFTPAKLEAASCAPAFASDAALSAGTDYGVCTVTAPPAQSTDGMPVVLYRAKAMSRFGTVAAQTWTLPCYYRAVEPEDITLTLEGLAAGTYTVRVTAENAYGKASDPIEITVTVEGDSALVNFPTRIRLFFEDLIHFLHQLLGI